MTFSDISRGHSIQNRTGFYSQFSFRTTLTEPILQLLNIPWRWKNSSVLLWSIGKFWTVRMTLSALEVWRWGTKIKASRDVWAFHHWADPLTVFCCMRQDCAHWSEQIWPLYDGFGLQLLYSWDNDVALEISFIFFATMFLPRAWRDLFSNQI